MKNNFFKSVLVAAVATFSFTLNAQTVSDFENLTLPSDSFWSGFDQPYGAVFTSGNAEFYNYVDYDAMYDFFFWDKGWAYSNKGDSVTAGYTNEYSTRAGSGYSGSSTFAIGKNNSVIRLTGNAAGKVVEGFYVTNSTYTYYSMNDGDFFGKQFGSPNNANGDPDGTNGEDWFLLTVKKYHNGVLSSDSVNFYLADFRFSDNLQDYILKTWKWVDLSSLGNADSLLFQLNSSDVGQFGMNTPGFFCIDNFTTRDVAVSVNERLSDNVNVSVYPNPAADFITLNFSDATETAQVYIFDAVGKMIYNENMPAKQHRISVAAFKSGLYRVVIKGDNFAYAKNFVKQ